MNVKSMIEFKDELVATLDSVSDGDDTVIINRQMRQCANMPITQ